MAACTGARLARRGSVLLGCARRFCTSTCADAHLRRLGEWWWLALQARGRWFEPSCAHQNLQVRPFREWSGESFQAEMTARTGWIVLGGERRLVL
jgi:hypothetical protein